MKMDFQNCCPRHPKKAFLFPKLRILIFVPLNKLEGVDNKYDNSFSIFQLKDPNRAFLVPIIFFWFWMKLYVFTNSRVLIKNLIIVFIRRQPKNT